MPHFLLYCDAQAIQAGCIHPAKEPSPDSAADKEQHIQITQTGCYPTNHAHAIFGSSS
jgi:hypothetical protein